MTCLVVILQGVHYFHLLGVKSQYEKSLEPMLVVTQEYFGIQASVLLIQRDLFDLLRTTYDQEENFRTVSSSIDDVEARLERIGNLPLSNEGLWVYEELKESWISWRKIAEEVYRLAKERNYGSAGLVIDEAVPTKSVAFNDAINNAVQFVRDESNHRFKDEKESIDNHISFWSTTFVVTFLFLMALIILISVACRDKNEMN